MITIMIIPKIFRGTFVHFLPIQSYLGGGGRVSRSFMKETEIELIFSDKNYPIVRQNV